MEEPEGRMGRPGRGKLAAGESSQLFKESLILLAFFQLVSGLPETPSSHCKMSSALKPLEEAFSGLNEALASIRLSSPDAFW